MSHRAVLRDSLTYRCPSRAPNGREFVASTFENGRSRILLIDLNTGARRTVLSPDSAYADCAQWSPRDNELLITVYRGTAGLYDESRRGYGSNLALLDLALCGFERSPNEAALPDSTDDLSRHETLEIYIVRRDGTGLRRLTNNTSFDGHPS